MRDAPKPQAWFRRTTTVGLAAFVGGALLSMTVAIATFLGPTAAYAQAGCDSSGTPVAVHYEVAQNSPPTVERFVAVSAVVLTGFPISCNGQAVKLEMRGNIAGDPSVAPSADTLLSTADSTLEPCTQKPLTAPLVVTNGSIALSLCATGGPASYVVVHDLTALSLFTSAAAGGVSGSTAAPSPTGGVAGIGVVTPSTGAASSFSAPLLVLGFALLLGGLMAVSSAARRRGL